MSDIYRVPASVGESEIKKKGSRFLAEVYHVTTEETAESRIADVRKREYNATHHCTAYRIGPAVDLVRANDDGEPSGTGGMPILRQIEARELTNTLVVVTRYYGGTKLGTGPLARAYSAAASEALDAAGVESRVLRERLSVRFDYPDTSAAMHVIQQFEGHVVESEYAEDTHLSVDLPESRVDDFLAAFTEALAGRGSAERVRVDGG